LNTGRSNRRKLNSLIVKATTDAILKVIAEVGGKDDGCSPQLLPITPVPTEFWSLTTATFELAYDPDDQLILIANDDDLDLFVTFISVSNVAGNIKVVGKISLPEADGCGIEQPVYDHASNRFYLAVPCTSAHKSGAIYVINPKTKAVKKIYDTIGTGVAAGVPCFPHGLALGPRQNLLLGCSGDGATGTQMISIIMKATTAR